MLTNLRHIIRYGTHAEREFLLNEYSTDYYDAVLLNGNMLAYSIGAMSAFVLRIKTPFLIDPQTHAFQHEIEYLMGKNGEPKRSLIKLAKYFGDPVESAILDKRKITPSDFSTQALKTSFVEAVVKFQAEAISEKISSQDEASYVDFAIDDPDNDLSKDNLQPIGVVAPYFYISDDNYSEWLTLNLEFANQTKDYVQEHYPTLDTLIQLVVSKEVLRDETKRNEIIDSYTGLDCDGILLWVDNFSEDEVSEEDLSIFINLVEALKQPGKSIHNLYGGYFSTLLQKITSPLDGVCHGLGYGESRGVIPVGGGIPILKYYFFPLHKRLPYPDLIRVLKANNWGEDGSKNTDFSNRVCNCDQCRNIPKFGESKPGKPNKKGVRRNYPTTEAKHHNLKHYLHSKVKEFRDVSGRDLDPLLQDLLSTRSEYLALLGENNAGHLLRWKTAIEESQEASNQ